MTTDAVQDKVLHLGNVGLTLDELIGRSWAVLGITGSGKSNSIAVMVEDLIESVPFVILDADGEYYSLKERFNFLIVGGEHSEVDVTVGNAGILAKAAYEQGQSIILDVSQISFSAAADLLHAYLAALWEVATVQRKPLFVVIEEASQFAPQGDRSALQDLLTQYAIRGRKRGIGLIVGNQRSSTVGKNVITQARYGLYHKVVHPTDMRVLKDLIPWDGKRVESTVRALTEGQAVFVRGDQVDVVSVRLRHTFHAGATPGVDAQTPALQASDPAFLADLRARLASGAPVPTGDVDAQSRHDETEGFKRQINTLTGELKAHKTAASEIAALQRIDGREKMPMVDYVRWQHKQLNEHIEKSQQRESVITDLRAKIAKTINLAVPSLASAPSATLASPSTPALKPGSVLDELVAGRQEKSERRLAQVKETAIRRQTLKLETDAKGVSRLERPVRSMLAYLLENPGKWADADIVGRMFAYELTNFRKRLSVARRDENLVRNLISRQGQDHLYRLNDSLAQQYPDLDIDTVRAALLKACGV